MVAEVFIVSAQRTAIGSFQGCYANTPTHELGAQAIQAALQQAKLDPQHVDECIMGQVLTAGSGQAPARQAALKAGLPQNIPCMTINKVCGSGLKSVMLAANAILLGQAGVVVAGGQENMTLSPHLMPKVRMGYRMGHTQVMDSMIQDGLWDPYNDFHMGQAAELCASKYNFSREAQDSFAIESYKRAQKAQSQGYFQNEITPVEIKNRKTTVTIEKDEEPEKARLDKLPSLRPAFDSKGTITAANASKINDGAAALVIASGEKVEELSLKPMAKITAYSHFAQDPKWFTTAPVGAIKKVLKNPRLWGDGSNVSSLSPSHIDLFEINEAFANVTMAAMEELSIPHEKVNIHGGAVALGHPIGASGARILTTLLYALNHRDKHKGLASLCIGGGEAVAMTIERV